ncbi:MAG TPA: bifunctional serine/threonine-protein kinase/formylglycine-generating enzyme family protein [Myxococcales bacterium]
MSRDPDAADALDQILGELAKAPPRPPPLDLVAGTLLMHRYRVDGCLGRGGMGAVYLATDTTLGRKVAVKVLNPREGCAQEKLKERLLREAAVAASVQHPRVAAIFDVGEHEGHAFVIMEYVKGATLRDWMRSSHAPVAIREKLVQIAQGLNALHANGIVHRDLKPENVMLPASDAAARDRADDGLKLLDFGLAGHDEALSQDLRRAIGSAGCGTELATSTYAGTPGYVAPEQYQGKKTDARADVFALGVIAVELVTGQRPFEPLPGEPRLDAIDPSRAHLDSPAWKSHPAALHDTAAKMLHRDPDQRYANGAAALRALQHAAGGHRGSTRMLWRRLLTAVVAVTLLIAARAAVQEHRRRNLLSAVPAGMALVEGGKLRVGHTAKELDAECAVIGPRCNREKMAREERGGTVEVEPFFLDQHEVTNAEMAEVLEMHVASLVVDEDQDNHYPRYVHFNAGLGHDNEPMVDLNTPGGIDYTRDRHFRVKPARGSLPVAQVTWFGAKLYCETRGKRLPTEDEWEAAARGRDDRAYPWGNESLRCGGAVLPADGMIRIAPGCAEKAAVAPVGQAPQDVTPQGIHDLAGNVAEWTQSPYVEDQRMAHPERPGDIPRVIRGGSWAPGSSYLARSSGRTGRPGSIAGANVGFRCARTIQ